MDGRCVSLVSSYVGVSSASVKLLAPPWPQSTEPCIVLCTRVVSEPMFVLCCASRAQNTVATVSALPRIIRTRKGAPRNKERGDELQGARTPGMTALCLYGLQRWTHAPGQGPGYAGAPTLAWRRGFGYSWTRNESLRQSEYLDLEASDRLAVVVWCRWL